MDGQKAEKYIIELKRDGPNQIEESYRLIEATNRKFWEMISEIYKSTESVENQRNINNEESHAKRLKHLEEFDENLPNDLKEKEDQVKVLLDIEQADQLQEEFDKFKKGCDDLMQKKKNLISEFTKELDFKDQAYVDNMKQFHKDIELMIKKMSEQFITLRQMMLEHLGKIEEKFLEDRKDLIKDQYLNYIKKLIALLEKIAGAKEKELTTLQDELEEKAELAAKKLENTFINKIIMMETHLNLIKEKVEEFFYDIKILFEKLEFRVKIRDEKIKEAEEKKDQFHSWNMKLVDKINYWMEIYKKSDLQKRIKNSQLRNELMKMTESFDQLKEKFQHFEKHDELVFKEIYDMKSKESKELALKVALADRTIKTQQLGMENIPNDNNNGFSLDELQKDQELEENDVVHVNNEEEQKNFRYNILAKIPTQRVKQVFEYIISEAEFLIETATIEACQGMTFEEKLPRYLESISKALNIKNEVELNQLLALFDKKNLNERNNEQNEENKEQNSENVSLNESNDDKEKDSNEFKIDPDDVLDILKEFYNEKKKKAKEQMLGNASSGTFNGEDNEEAKRERMKYLSETYWEKLGNIISEKTFHVWNALDNSLSSYHQLLFERKELVDEVKDLNEKRSELRKLLKQYQDSDINRILDVPPAKTIKWEELNIQMNYK